MAGWGAKFENVVVSWPGGVRTSARADLIPSNTSPAALNASWENVGDGSAVPVKRRGCALMNTGSPVDAAIVGQAFYEKLSSGVFTNYHVLFAEDGDLHTIATNGTVTNHTSGEFSTSIAGQFVSSAEAKNYLYVVAGTACTAGGVTGTMLRFDGTNWRVGGMAAPPVPTANDSIAGVMSGTYEWAVTYHNSNTGFESSRSPTATNSPSNEQTQVTWTASSDAQVTHVHVYVRKSTISTGFYRATSIAVGSTVVTLNISDDDYNALTILAPDTDENDPPPSGVKYLAWHKSRMFAATDTEVYYSKVELPEAFDPEKYEPVNPSDGQKITGILDVYDKLVILKDHSIYVLAGNGPNDWFIEEVSHEIGCVAPGSICTADGRIYWWSQDGPVVWDGISEPVLLGKALVQATVDPLVLSTAYLSRIVGVQDPRQSRIMWAVPVGTQTRNSTIIPFKYQLGQFEGTWTSVEPASFVIGKDENLLEWVFLGGYNGRVYKWWSGRLDGVPTGASYTGLFTPGATSTTSIATTGLNTSTGYTDLFVTVVSDGEIIGRRKISTNTATTITLSQLLGGLSTSTEYTYYIGSADFVFDSKWQDDDAAFYKKRYEFVYMETEVDSDSTVHVDLHTNQGANAEGPREWTLNAAATDGASGSLWDYMLWDSGIWAATAPETHRLRIAKTGRTWRIRVTHVTPLVEFKLLKLGVRGEYLTDKT